MILMRTALLVIALVVSAGNSPASAYLVVPDLPPGTQYRLAFVTSTTRNATSPSIADYNAFVTGVANTQPDLTALSTTWTVIGSTVPVSAIANTMTDPTPAGDNGVPIFRLDGVKIADHYDDLWDSSLDATLSIDETGGTVLAFLWTGSTSTGLPYPSFELGSATPIIGSTLQSDLHWISTGTSLSVPRSFYAMSGVLTAVPEARAWLMLGAVTACAVGFKARWCWIMWAGGRRHWQSK